MKTELTRQMGLLLAQLEHLKELDALSEIEDLQFLEDLEGRTSALEKLLIERGEIQQNPKLILTQHRNRALDFISRLAAFESKLNAIAEIPKSPWTQSQISETKDNFFQNWKLIENDFEEIQNLFQGEDWNAEREPCRFLVAFDKLDRSGKGKLKVSGFLAEYLLGADQYAQKRVSALNDKAQWLEDVQARLAEVELGLGQAQINWESGHELSADDPIWDFSDIGVELKMNISLTHELSKEVSTLRHLIKTSRRHNHKRYNQCREKLKVLQQEASAVPAPISAKWHLENIGKDLNTWHQDLQRLNQAKFAMQEEANKEGLVGVYLFLGAIISIVVLIVLSIL